MVQPPSVEVPVVVAATAAVPVPAGVAAVSDSLLEHPASAIEIAAAAMTATLARRNSAGCARESARWSSWDMVAP